MVHCIVVGCSSNSRKNNNLGFFRIPSGVDRGGEEAEELSRERRERWISAISRDDVSCKDVLKNERVCGKHFVSGRPAAGWDKYNVDWVPSLNLGKVQYGIKENPDAVKARAERAKERRKRCLQLQEREAEGKRSLIDISGEPVANIEFEKSGDTTMSSLTEMETPHLDIGKNETASTATQTEEFEYMFSTNNGAILNQEYFNSDEKVRFYTGLPSKDVLMTVFDHVSLHITRRSHTLDKFQEFVMVLMKVRLNVPFQDLAYRFEVSLSTVSRIFSTWLTVMDIRLSPLIYWPERDQLRKTMPMCFKQAFGNKVTVIIDCFEVFIDRPTNLLARAQTFSSYKHHNTIKILIGITPQGTISYVSDGWGGRTSDKFLTENCNILDKLLPGDMVMADRGFTIAESVGFKQAKLVIPAFTKGKAQLDPIDVETTRGIANVRIHVERVIGLLRCKYTILQSTLPTDYLTCSKNGGPDTKTPIIDKILRVCSALVNLCPPIVPFD